MLTKKQTNKNSQKLQSESFRSLMMTVICNLAFAQALWWRLQLSPTAVSLHRTPSPQSARIWLKNSTAERRIFVHCRGWKVCLDWHQELHISCWVRSPAEHCFLQSYCTLMFSKFNKEDVSNPFFSLCNYHTLLLLCFLDLQLQEGSLIYEHAKLLQMGLRSFLTMCNSYKQTNKKPTSASPQNTTSSILRYLRKGTEHASL